MRERGPFCKSFFPEPRNVRARNDFVNHFYSTLNKGALLIGLKRAFVRHASLTWIFVWGFLFLFDDSDIARISIWQGIAEVVLYLAKEEVEGILGF